MKSVAIVIGLLASSLFCQAQDRLPREEALKYAFAACTDLKQLQNTPIATDPDVKLPVVCREGEYGAMVLPETKLSAENLAKVGKEVKSIGQLWLHKLAPLTEGTVVKESQLRVVSVNSPEGSLSVPLCALGICRNADGKLELQVFGKEKTPVLRAPVKEIQATQEYPVELAAERRDDGGLLTVRILGKYEANFMVTDPELY
jgi:hypothetical protein